MWGVNRSTTITRLLCLVKGWVAGGSACSQAIARELSRGSAILRPSPLEVSTALTADETGSPLARSFIRQHRDGPVALVPRAVRVDVLVPLVLFGPNVDPRAVHAPTSCVGVMVNRTDVLRQSSAFEHRRDADHAPRARLCPLFETAATRAESMRSRCATAAEIRPSDCYTLTK